MKALTFQDISLVPVKQDSQIWLSSSDLAQALGYSQANAVTKLYNANTDEFTPCMTTIAEIQTNGGLQKTRIFSLRGCHLVAMFARTKIAKDFRKWVLDILDGETGSPKLTDAQQRELANKVRSLCKGERKHYSFMWNALKDHFNVERYSEIASQDFQEALALIESIQLPALIEHQPFNIHDYLNQQSNQVMDYVHQLEYAVFELTGKYPQRPFSKDEIAKGVIGACVNNQTIELTFSERGFGFHMVDRTTLRIHDSNIANHIKMGNVSKQYLDDIIQASVSRLA